MSETEQEEPQYRDGMKEYGMKGTVIPPATTRAQSKAQEGAPAEGIGAHFDLHKPVPHNIVEIRPDGSQHTTKLSAEALSRLQQANRRVAGTESTDKPIGYAEAVSGQTKQASTGNGNGRLTPTRRNFHGASAPRMPAPAAPAVATPRTRTMVKFEGTFGRLSVPYDSVYQDAERDDLLVMVQHNPDGNHFEAPESDDYILVNIGEHQYVCLSGVQFCSEDRKTHYTIFVIDFSKMEEPTHGGQEG